MTVAQDTYGNAFKNGTVTNLARVTGADAANIVQADISSAVYSVYLLDDQAPDTRGAVANHAAAALAVASIIFDTLQTDDRWTKDSTGYNFRHVIDVSSNQAFTVAGRRYLVEYTLTPASGQKILLRFRVNCI